MDKINQSLHSPEPESCLPETTATDSKSLLLQQQVHYTSSCTFRRPRDWPDHVPSRVLGIDLPHTLQPASECIIRGPEDRFASSVVLQQWCPYVPSRNLRIGLLGPNNTVACAHCPDAQGQACSAHHHHHGGLQSSPPGIPVPSKASLLLLLATAMKVTEKLKDSTDFYSQRNRAETTLQYPSRIKTKTPYSTNTLDTSVGKISFPVRANP